MFIDAAETMVVEQLQTSRLVSWVHGAHNMLMGGDVELTKMPSANPKVTRGTMSFQTFPDFLLV